MMSWMNDLYESHVCFGLFFFPLFFSYLFSFLLFHFSFFISLDFLSSTSLFYCFLDLAQCIGRKGRRRGRGKHRTGGKRNGILEWFGDVFFRSL